MERVESFVGSKGFMAKKKMTIVTPDTPMEIATP